MLLWGNVSSQIHLISPGCPWPNSALTVHKSGLKHRSSIHFLFKAHQVRPDRGLNSSPPDHDSTLHVTETPALTTQPSVTLLHVTETPALTTRPSVTSDRQTDRHQQITLPFAFTC